MPYRPNFPIPENINPPQRCIQLCIPDDPTYMSVFAGLIYQLTYWYNWERTDGNEGAQCAAVWKEIYNSTDWSIMSCCPDDTILGIRFTATGAMEVTFDGTTYVPAEDSGDDPRYTSPQLPPQPDTGIPDDNKCRSATNVVSAMHDAVEEFGGQLGTVGSIIEFAGVIVLAIVGVFVVPPSATVLIPIVIGLAGAIFEIASGTYLALFTDSVYDTLQCLFYCNCGSDGTFNAENFTDILSGIDSSGFDSNVALTFYSVISGWALPGLNSAARGGSLETGDCSDCCPSCVGNWEWGVPEWSPTGYVTGDDYIEVDAYAPGNGYWYWPLKVNDSSLCCDFVVTGTFDPATTSFCARYPCGEGDANFGTEGAPWINDALAAPHGLGVGVMVRANYAFTARITFT